MREDALARGLRTLEPHRHSPETPEARDAIIHVLRGRQSHAVAKAAEMAAQGSHEDLRGELKAALQRFLELPVRADPGCVAKEKCARALVELGGRDLEDFERACHHRQLEPVWGGRVDTAAGLRAVAAMGVARSLDPAALNLLAELLADAETAARVGAARALGVYGAAGAGALLRLRVYMGDPDGEVMGECFSSVLALEGRAGEAWVGEVLENVDSPPAVAEAAAMALGSCRSTSAVVLLLGWHRRVTDLNLRASGAVALALSRAEGAMDYLIEAVRCGEPRDGRNALEALVVFRHDESLMTRLAEAVGRRGDGELDGELERRLAD